MSIISKIKEKLNFKTKVLDNEKDFDRVQKISGGNLFEKQMELNAQEQIDIATLRDRMMNLQDEYDDVMKEIKSDLIDRHTIQPYYLLQLQANYFCGTCKYECDNWKFTRVLQEVIRCSFLYGIAGIYFKEGYYFPIWISRINKDITGKITMIEYGSLYDAISSQDGNTDELKVLTAKGKECENIVYFKWGTLGVSAWVMIWPFVLFQAMLLKMIVVQSVFYNKKALYKVTQKTRVKSEIKKFFDPTEIFIWVLADENISNKFEMLDISPSTTGGNFLEYYKETIAIYYHLYGRRLNNDDKKERNVTSEIQATQENYDVVQSDWLIQFRTFIEHLKEKVTPLGINVEYIDEQKEKERIMEKQWNQEKDELKSE